ncbi:MAG TPA: amino acid adenylation domain-containing protein [Pyrinomonadaceae bacterium]|jgi:amino acid adenylation domain-containing protein|nr:amino acid adenylation domain-containing protein [Pyrinomonadaceae bacterium]
MPQSTVENSNLEAHAIIAAAGPLAELHGERLPQFTDTPVSRLFEQQVAVRRDAVAIVCQDAQLTFGELNARANQLAHYLRTFAVGRESIVAICMDRSIEMAIAIVATLKAGAAYLPLDPEYPQERLTFMLEDAQPAVVLTKAALQIRWAPSQSVISLDMDWPAISLHSKKNLDDAPRKDDLAYVIYTSGSTGKPKGAMITQGGLANYLRALNHELKIKTDDLYLHTASIAFSSSRRQLLLPLSQGATVAVATSDERKDPIALFRTIKARGITIMDAVPSMWRSCTTILRSLPEAERCELLDNRLRLMLSASEPLLSEIPRAWMHEFNHSAEHVHMFGQTETAGIVALFRIPRDYDGDKHVPVGNAIANTDIYVLDENQRPCARGQAGELYIAGAGVGRSYLNRPDLTAEKFIEREGLRLYRAGDWAKVSFEGRLEFAGRRDQQVKLRGFRVELGEIEAALAKHPSVRECVVVARDLATNSGEDKRLIAYFVPEKPVAANELRAYLAARIPDYQVPSVFVEMQALPLSANGKVDRLRLPEPEDSRAAVRAEFVAPQNEIEILLSQIWSDVLSIETVGRNDNFFELGGHSLLAAQIAARIRSQFKVEVPISALFELPTIKLLAERISSGGDDSIHTISRAERNNSLPLSFNQQQFWLLDQVSPNRATYNVSTGLKIDGPLDVAKLQSVVDCIVARHEVLRTNVMTINDGPVQVISPLTSIPVRLTDLSKLSVAEAMSQRASILAGESKHLFDLSSGPLMRVRLLKFGERQHQLLITLHHIVCDGWSVNVLLRELTHLYLKNLDATALPQLSIQYADFAVWQRRWLADEAIERQLNYWRRQLANVPTALELPADFSLPASRTYEGGRVSTKLSLQLCKSIRKLSRDQNATLFMVLLAAFQALLFRYSSQEDVVVGTPVAGRTMFETEDLIGAFVNTLVLRTDLSGAPTFREVLARVRATVMAAFCHQDVPFEKLVEELNPERKANRSPLFQVMFSFQNMPEPELAVNGTKFTTIKIDNDAAKFDLTLEVDETPDAISISFEYAKDLFAAATINRMLGHFLNLLNAVVSDPAKAITDVELLTAKERNQLLVEWNSERMPYPEAAVIHELFEAQAELTPDALAVEFAGERLTYRELNARANQLAHYLIKRGVGSHSMVGIHLDRSFEMVIAILGALKTGAAYLPLDPAYPRDRIAFMIEDAAARIVLTHSDLVQNIEAEAELILVDRDWQGVARESDDNPRVQISASQLALVLYTSGSTGNPKGVMLEHGSLVNFVTVARSAYGIKPADRVLQFGSLSFDLSAEEILLTLTSGACLILRTAEMISSPQEFLSCCERWNLSVLDLPTVYWHELTDALDRQSLTLPPSIRLVIIGGEKAASDRVAVWNRIVGQRVCLLNTYGPTETTVVVTLCDLSRLAPSAIPNLSPIGRPFPNATLYVLDTSLRPVPIGVPGELHIGGPGVARGYLNRAELTSEKFIPNPFSDDSSSRLYKSGDVVRYLADGNLEFLGRSDNQIKLRGFRVELEEIERAIRSHEAIENCVVIATNEIDKRLVAYVITSDNSRERIAEVRNLVKAKLPSYMVPAAFEVIDEFPMTSSGKIDRRALPAPQFNRSVDSELDLPATPLEEMLLEMWRQILKVDQIGINQNFFDLGGHSLLAVKLFLEIQETFGRNLPLATLFQAPTVRQLACVLRDEGWQGEWSSLVPIQTGGARTPFFCIHAVGGNVLEYHELARLLGPDQPFYGLQAKGLDGKSDPHTSIKEMAAHYLKEMREIQPHGPYLLGGRSSGGTIAFEMACQLKASGEEVALLALFDTFPAGYFKLLNLSFGKRLMRRTKKWQSHLLNLRSLNAADKVSYIMTKLQYVPAKAKQNVYSRAYKIYRQLGKPLPHVLQNIEQINSAAVRDYQPQVYSGDTVLFLATDLTSNYDLKDGWRELVKGRIETHEIPGNHLNIIKEPGVRTLAAKLRPLLDQAA